MVMCGESLSARVVAASVRSRAQAAAAGRQGGQGGGGGQGRPSRPPSITERTQDLKKLDGFFPLYWDEATGTLFMEISRFNQEVLYLNGLAAGLGSNDIGLDRAQLGGTRIVKFERVGPKMLMVEPNYDYRATLDESGRAQGGARTRSRSRSSGASPSRPRRTAACSSISAIS